MEKRIFAAALTAAALSWSVGSVSAQSSGTAAEAKTMLDNAVVALKANEATALAAFNDKSNTKFRDRDLYVFCFDKDGRITALDGFEPFKGTRTFKQIDVAAPETRNSPITAAYVIRQYTHRTFKMTKEA